MSGAFDQLVNFRDIGGVPSNHGGTVRSGVVFRAGLFSFVGADASTRMVEELGVRTVIDLRTDQERAEHPQPPMYDRHDALTEVHEPFFTGADLASLSLPRGHERDAWSTRYAAYTEVAGRYAVVSVFRQILADGASPTVFHCWSGKDRTGLTAAFLLDVLGVDDVDIGQDYQRSMDWWMPRLQHGELSESEPMAGYRTTSDVILLALDKLRQRFGSIESMLLSSGMDPTMPDGLRSTLLR